MPFILTAESIARRLDMLTLEEAAKRAGTTPTALKRRVDRILKMKKAETPFVNLLTEDGPMLVPRETFDAWNTKTSGS